MLLYHLFDSAGNTVSGNLPPNYFAATNFDNYFKQREVCEIFSKPKRHCYFEVAKGACYVACIGDDYTHRSFEKYLEVFATMSMSLTEGVQNIRETESQNMRRIKHNLITYNTNILQEIYKLLPQQILMQAYERQGELIQEKISENSQGTTLAIQRILQNANLMKLEFDVYDLLRVESPSVQIMNHSIHKVIKMTISPFWIDLIGRGIRVTIGSCHEEVKADYRLLAVALCHIYDNTIKYSIPNSDLDIRFGVEGSDVICSFEMTSLKVEKSELDSIFSERFSGKWSKGLGRAGNGIGMSVMRKSIELNNGRIKFEANVIPAAATALNGIPFERNRIVVNLPRH